MKQMLVMSDTHYEERLIERIVKAHPQCELYVHCGDSQLSANARVLQPFIVVAGNTDRVAWQSDEYVMFGDYPMMVTHGHRYQVNWGLDQLVQKAKQERVEIVCFGHTHVPLCVQVAGVLFINPGSVTSPRGAWSFGTYAVIEYDPKAEAQLKVRFYASQTHELVDEQIVNMS